VLQYAAEGQFLRHGRQECHEQNVNYKNPDGIGRKEAFCEHGCRFFLLLHPYLNS